MGVHALQSTVVVLAVDAGDAPIDNLDLAAQAAVCAEEADVLGFQVAMHDPATVRVLHSLGDLKYYVRGEGFIQAWLAERLSVGNGLVQVASLTIFHDQGHGVPILIGLIQFANVGVVQRLHDLDLLAEGRLPLFAAHRHLLDRDFAVGTGKVAPDAHAAMCALADLRVNLVALLDACVGMLWHEDAGVNGSRLAAAARLPERQATKPGTEPLMSTSAVVKALHNHD
mmetsp:Transcript_40624/g.128723  ORF Transcript_40624/g.128723 Transcript_40624/m.128723 type:complete len:227 (+) Transcript_40624:1368-2048(+)